MSIIKCGHNLHYEKFQDGTVKCIEDEIPFEVPDSWRWTRLCSLAVCISDGDHQPPPQVSLGIPFLVISNVSGGYLSFDNTRFVSEDYYESLPSTRKPCIGDLLFTVTGSYGITIPVDIDRLFCFQRHIALIRPCLVSNKYLSVMLSTTYIKAICDDKATGTAQKTVGLATLRDILIPVAPIEEQARICETYDKADILTNLIQKSKDDLQASIDKTKKKILELAIRGQLLPQNPNDESASVLLERIRADKEELVKQGKLKRDKKESIIYKGDDNSYYEKFVDGEEKNIAMHIPFAVPKSWSWCRLRHIGNVIGGGTPKTAIDDYWDGDVPWITPADLSGYNEMYISGGARNISVLGLSKSSAQLMPAGTVLFSSRAPIGYVAIANNVISTNQGFKSFVPATNEITSDYMYYCLKAMCGSIAARASGTTFKEISGTEMAETLVPLPPVNEQKKIVECIKSFYTCINNIEASLN